MENDPLNLLDPTGLVPWWERALEAAGNVTAGFADPITFGVTDWLRRKQGVDQFVDPCSGAYGLGELAATAHDVARGGAKTLTKLGVRAAQRKATREVIDYATRRTEQRSADYRSEREARALAREMIGSDPVEVEPGKWRSADGKWQYRAKPGDVDQNHVHLEELDPLSGEILQNWHLRWP